MKQLIFLCCLFAFIASNPLLAQQQTTIELSVNQQGLAYYDPSEGLYGLIQQNHGIPPRPDLRIGMRDEIIYRSFFIYSLTGIPENAAIISVRVLIEPEDTGSYQGTQAYLGRFSPSAYPSGYECFTNQMPNYGEFINDLNIAFDHTYTAANNDPIVSDIQAETGPEYALRLRLTDENINGNWVETKTIKLWVTYEEPVQVPDSFQVTVENSFQGGKVIVGSDTVPSGSVFTWEENSEHTLKAFDQDWPAPNNYYRVFQHWIPPTGIPNYNNPLTITVTQDGTYEAKFLKRFDFEVDNYFVDGGSGGTIKVNEQVKPAPDSITIIEGETVEVEAPTQSQTIYGTPVTYNFLVWSDGNTDNPRTFTPNDHTDITAKYKAHLISLTSTATAYNNQRKLARDNAATWHLVYEDNGSIYYTQSLQGDYHHDWRNEVLLAGGYEGAYYKNPSIDLDSDQNLHLVYEQRIEYLSDYHYLVIYRKKPRDEEWEPPDTLAPLNQGWYGLNNYATPVIWADSPEQIFVAWRYSQGLVLRYFDDTYSWGWYEPIPGTTGTDRFPSIARTIGGYDKTKLVWLRGQNSIYYIEGDPTSEGWEWNQPENLTEGYGGEYVLGAPSITTRVGETHIAWYGHSAGYYVSPIFYLDKNSGILTELSAYPYVFESPSISTPSYTENLALSYFDPYLNEVYSSLYSNGEWSDPPGIGGYTGHFPTLNHSNTTSNVTHMVYTGETELPYRIKDQILYYPEGLESGGMPVVYSRRADLNLGKITLTGLDSLATGILTVDFYPDSSQMRFRKGPNIKPVFLNSLPFVAGLQPLRIRLMLRLSRFQLLQAPPPNLRRTGIHKTTRGVN